MHRERAGVWWAAFGYGWGSVRRDIGPGAKAVGKNVRSEAGLEGDNEIWSD